MFLSEAHGTSYTFQSDLFKKKVYFTKNMFAKKTVRLKKVSVLNYIYYYVTVVIYVWFEAV